MSLTEGKQVFRQWQQASKLFEMSSKLNTSFLYQEKITAFLDPLCTPKSNYLAGRCSVAVAQQQQSYYIRSVIQYTEK